MPEKAPRDIEKRYSTSEFVAKLRRLADALENGERFEIPDPDKLVFVSWFAGGEVFRSGCCFNRGDGKIFYFRPGHETFPIFHNPEIMRVITNAVRWAAPLQKGPKFALGNAQPLEKLK